MRVRIVIVIVAVVALTALDLNQRGLLWQFAWSITGEEEPVAQLRALPQWAMRYTRPQPRTAATVPIDHTGEIPFGINTFLHQEVEVPKIERMLEMISDAGFVWIREQFPWEDIEVDGRDQFSDSRNDIDGDSKPDRVDAWIKYDRIVDLADQYGLNILARLDNPPGWSRTNPDIGPLGPPDDFQDFVNFAVATAERYQGRIQHYQIWNEPNLFVEWGNRPVDAVAFTELLCRTYDALKSVDPDLVIHAPALSPTIALDGNNLNDLIYLQQMYDAGAADCFDVMSAQGYGLFSGPTDRRMRPTVINVGHHIYIRDMMVANGDAHKPIWISEAAWNSVPPPEEVPNIVGIRDQFGQVTQEQAAEYMPDYYQRAQEEWPWLGVIHYWFFTRRDNSERNQPKFYFRMVEPDYSADDPNFTPLPVYHSMRDYITTLTPTLYKGVHQADAHWAIHAGPTSTTVDDESAQFGRALTAESLAFTASGTHIVLRWHGNSPIDITVDDETITLTPDEMSGWRRSTIHTSLTPRTVSVQLNGPIQVDSITVLDRTFENVFPLLTAGFVLVFMLVLSLVVGWRSRKETR
jgi:polysaccharide biosynthesis protein PslG